MSDMNSLLTRREFLGLAEALGIGILVVAVSGSIHRADSEFSFSRPPGCLPEEQFLARCLRCDKCKVACAWGVIRPIEVSESAVKAGTPMLKGRCHGCTSICSRSCPTGAMIRT
jgi:ferredoxin-type protein NapG